MRVTIYLVVDPILGPYSSTHRPTEARVEALKKSNCEVYGVEVELPERPRIPRVSPVSVKKV